MESKVLKPEEIKTIGSEAASSFVVFDTSVLQEVYKAADPAKLAPFASSLPKFVQDAEKVKVVYYSPVTGGGTSGVIDPYTYTTLPTKANVSLVEKELTWGGVGYQLSVPYVAQMTKRYEDYLQVNIVEAMRAIWLDVEYLTFRGNGSSGQPLGIISQITATMNLGTASLTLSTVVEALGSIFTALGGPNASLDGKLFLPPSKYQNFLNTEIGGLAQVQYVVTQSEERIVAKPKRFLDLAYGTIELVPCPHLAGTMALLLVDPCPYFGPNARMYCAISSDPVLFKPDPDIIRYPAQLIYLFQPYIVNPTCGIKIVGTAL